MKVTFIKKNGTKIVYNHAYEVYEHKKCIDNGGEIDEVSEYITVVYPDELDYGVEAEMDYHTDSIERVEITFTGE